MPDDKAVRDALEKKGAFGTDIDIDRYEDGTSTPDQIDDLQSSDYQRYMENVGVVADEINRSGTLMFIDNGMSHCLYIYRCNRWTLRYRVSAVHRTAVRQVRIPSTRYRF